MVLTLNEAQKLAEHLTIAAIEASMVPVSTDVKQSAKNVTDFYIAIVENFVPSLSKQKG